MVDRMDHDDDMLAAELVMGLLEPADRAQALRKQLAEPEFAAKIDAWQQRIDPLYLQYPDMQPDPSVWNAIEDRLGGRGESSAIAMVNRWKWGAIGSGALAACLALALLIRPAQQLPPAADGNVAVAQLTGEIEGLLLAVSYDPATAQMKVSVNGMPQTETEPEIWIVDRSGAYNSLGQVARDGISAMTIAEDHRSLINEASSIVVTMEPPSEKPHEKPSGEPVASGKISII